MANYKTGAEMHTTAKVETGIGWIAVTVGEGYYEVYIDKKLQKSAFNGQTRSYAVDPGDHLVGVYSAGQWVVNETIHVPAEGETVPEHDEQPAPMEEPDTVQPEPEQPTEEPAIEEQNEIITMDFAQAITAVKAGKRIQRAEWNGKAQYIELATCISYKNAAGEIVNAEHMAIGNQALAFVGTSGVQIGWLASQADMLANDWRVVE